MELEDVESNHIHGQPDGFADLILTNATFQRRQLWQVNAKYLQFVIPAEGIFSVPCLRKLTVWLIPVYFKVGFISCLLGIIRRERKQIAQSQWKYSSPFPTV